MTMTTHLMGVTLIAQTQLQAGPAPQTHHFSSVSATRQTHAGTESFNSLKHVTMGQMIAQAVIPSAQGLLLAGPALQIVICRLILSASNVVTISLSWMSSVRDRDALHVMNGRLDGTAQRSILARRYAGMG